MSNTDQIAPGELELLQGFVNTLDVEEGTEALGDGAEAAGWFAAHDVPIGETEFSPAELERLIRFREALRALLLANNTGEPPPAEALELLNAEAAETEIGLHFTPAGADLVTRCEGVDCAIARILAVAHEAMRDGSWPRLKVCPAEDCQWAFYDLSRNRSKTWCAMGVCGNRAKARNFRERRKAAAGA